MPLTYMKRVATNVPAYTEVETEITVPKHWGMYKPAGDKRISELAAKFLAVADSDAKYTVKIESAFEFLRSYRGLSKHKTYSEAGDTDVREQVGDFFDKVCEASGLDYGTLWEHVEGYPEDQRW